MSRLFTLLTMLAICSPAFAQPDTAGPAGLFFRRTVAAPQAVPSVAPKAETNPVDQQKAAHPQATDPPEPREVDSAEVTRRGDRVTRSGTGPMGVGEQLLSDATSPPADDSHKWFFSIIVDDGQESQALQYDLKHSPALRAWMNVDEPKDSWSHCTIYKRGDATQEWRWKGLSFSGYPVMILQPPAKLRDENQPDSWEWGNPKTVVWQWDRYDVTKPNRAQIRSDAIRTVLKAYIDKLSSNPQFARSYAGPRAAAPPPTKGARQVDAGPRQDNIGINPPFAIPQQPTTPSGPVFPVFPADPTTVVAHPQGVTTPNVNVLGLLLQLMGGTVTGSGMTNFLLLAIALIQLWRSYAQSRGMKTLLGDDAFGGLVSLLKTLTGQQNTTNTNTNASGQS